MADALGYGTACAKEIKLQGNSDKLHKNVRLIVG